MDTADAARRVRPDRAMLEAIVDGSDGGPGGEPDLVADDLEHRYRGLFPGAADAAGRHTVQVGGTVRRPAGWWTPAVTRLLTHLFDVGFPAPLPLFVDTHQREVLSLIAGDVGEASWAHIATDDGLAAYARLLRRFHDAVRSFPIDPRASWKVPRDDDAPELVRHGDPGPWNVVWRDGAPVGLVGWDLARPGSALDDVAWALVWSVPLRPDAEAVDGWGCWRGAPPDRRHRLGVFVEAYGVDALPARAELLARAVSVLARTHDSTRVLAALGVEPQSSFVASGGDVVLPRMAAWIDAHAAGWLR